MSGQPERLAAGETVKILPMTINDRGRNPAQAGHCTLTPSGHKSEQAGLRKPEGLSETWLKTEAAKLPECWPGQHPYGVRA